MKKQKQFDYDLIIIGSGAGGSVAAHIANRSGQNVAIIEAERIGGECPNIGCVPTKAILQAAEVYEAAKHGGRFGIRGNTVGYNYPSIKAWKDLAVKRTGTYLGEEMYTSEGISVIKGSAHFIDPHTVTVGVVRLRAKKFLIATGSTVAVPPIPGLEKAGYLTYKEAINLTRPPKSVAIIGGGPIGCEFATALAIFGTKIYLIDAEKHLLNREEPETSALIEERFIEDYSMSLHLGSFVDKVEKSGTKKKLTLRTDGATSTVNVDEILVATGKRGVVDIGLENAGVTHDKTSILTDHYMQTAAPHIYAAGDCVGPYLFTHMATYQSRIAVNNMLHRKNKYTVDYRAVPRCTFTNPEVASVGATEAELKKEKIAYKAASVPISVIGRANTSDFSDGFVKVLAEKKTGVLLGGTVVCPRAGEVIHELALGVQQGMTAQNIADTIHAFPTWSEALRVACAKLTKRT